MSQLEHYEQTLKAIASAYAHGPTGEKTCQCAACVAERALKTWNPDL